jgi:nitrate reductase gamma subunit
MGIILSLGLVAGLVGLAWVLEAVASQTGATALYQLLGVWIPYVAAATFILGFLWRILEWARVPVPFRIPTTSGQQKSLPWIKQSKLDNPSSTLGVIGRMLLEVLLFRSLFKNTKADVKEGPRLIYGSAKWLWMAGLAFHWSFLIIFVRHFRLFVDPPPAFVGWLEWGDGFLQMTLPTFYITDAVILIAVTYLFLRRFFIPQVKYISLANDYFPLFLILGIAVTGILMRYILKVDIVSVKALVHGIFSFNAAVPEELTTGRAYMFFIHLMLVCALLVYFPFSKLMHMGGVFMSPTRNMINNSRTKLHVNPWNDPNIKPHSYEEYEEEFHKAMEMVGLPLEKEYKEEEK